jgi:hypothetical protein
MDIEYLDPDSPDVQALIAASDAYYIDLYPADSNHLESTEDLKKPNVLFVGCRIDDELVASGAAKILQHDVSYAEIKRVFVLAQHRGKGCLHSTVVKACQIKSCTTWRVNWKIAVSQCFVSRPGLSKQRPSACIASSDTGNVARLEPMLLIH